MIASDLYLRKSTSDRGHSISSQESDCLADILAEGWTLGHLFVDEELSASRFARKARPDYQALVGHVDDPDATCKVLTMWEASRGSRDLTEWLALLESCRRQNKLIRVTSHRRTYDVHNRRDWRTLVEEGLDAADESNRTSERTRRIHRARAADGMHHGRTAYGLLRMYDSAGKFVKTVEHPEQAPIVREIARRLLKGDSASEIARDLNERGVATPHGDGPWSATQVSRMPTRPIYAGRRVHLGQYVATGKWPAILDEVTWQRCVQLLKDPDRRKQRGTRLKYNLAGVPKCGSCGGLLRTGGVGRGRRLYLCVGCGKVSVSADTFDGIVLPMLLRWAATQDLSFLWAPPEDDPEALAAKAEAEALTARLDAHYDEAAAGDLSAAGLAAMERRLLPQIAAARRRAERVAGPPPLWHLEGVDVVADWETLPVGTQRAVIMACCEIIVDPAARPGGRYFDIWRLARSHWRGDTRTWGDIWTASGAPGVRKPSGPR